MPSKNGEPERPFSSVAGAGGRLASPVFVQFVKFGIVGVSNTALTFIVYTVLLKVFGVWYLAASAVGFIVGATNGFLLNRRWTFRDHVGDAFTPVRWATVQGCGLAIRVCAVREVRHRRRLQHGAHVHRLHRPAEGLRQDGV